MATITIDGMELNSSSDEAGGLLSLIAAIIDAGDTQNLVVPTGSSGSDFHLFRITPHTKVTAYLDDVAGSSLGPFLTSNVAELMTKYVHSS